MTINHSDSRNFELMTLSKNAEGLTFRQWSQAANDWTTWRRIATENENGALYYPGSFTMESSLPYLELVGTGTDNYSSSGIAFKNFTTASQSYYRIFAQRDGSTGQDVGNLDLILRKTNNGDYITYLHVDDDTNDVILNSAANGSQAFGNVIVKNANLLVGKTSQANSNYRLDIDGTVRANEIVVNTTGADFVFEPDYTLPDLSEVHRHIRENGHLPGVPSAAAMQQEGMAVGELNTILLQKIEELTLYLIELKEENEAQGKLIMQQQNELNKLKSRIP